MRDACPSSFGNVRGVPATPEKVLLRGAIHAEGTTPPMKKTKEDMRSSGRAFEPLSLSLSCNSLLSRGSSQHSKPSPGAAGAVGDPALGDAAYADCKAGDTAGEDGSWKGRASVGEHGAGEYGPPGEQGSG